MASENQYYHRVQSALSPVDKVTIERTITGVNQLEYYITKVNWNGETDPYLISITDGPNVLSSNAIIKLIWDRDPDVWYYKVYGRKSGTDFGLLEEIIQPSLASENPSFTDDGSIVPDSSETLPTENTTGREKWDRFLFKPGRNLQAAEANDIQLLQSQYLERLGSAVYHEGDIIDGCEVFDFSSPQSEIELAHGELSITEGSVFLFGKIRHSDSTGVIVSPSAGKSQLGIIAEKVVISSNTDSSLKDPATDARNYNKTGADALQIKITWGIDIPGMLPIFEIEDGYVTRHLNKFKSNLGKFADTLSETIYDHAGDFVVKDFPISLSVDPDYDKRFRVNVEPGGVLYIKGVKVELVGKQKVETNKGRDTELINGNLEFFQTATKLYKMNLNFVASVGDVVGQANKSDQITKGQPNATDNLSEPTGISATDVYYGATHYTETVDYIFLGNQISWSPGGSEPPTGVTYTVDYVYSRTMEKGKRVKTLIEGEAITRGAGSTDNLANEDIISVTMIGNTSASPDYTETDDYIVDKGQTETAIGTAAIDWTPGGSEPGLGNTYYVTYTYWEHVIEGDFVSSDSYSSYPDINIINNKNLRDYIDFRPTGNEPINNTNFSYDYEIYLGRIDLLYFDQESFFPMIWPGQPSRKPRIGTHPINGFVVAQIIIPPYTYNINQVIVKPDFVPVYTMKTINWMNKRVGNIEYYILLENLEKDALYIETPALKKGVFTDSFLGHDKIDFGYRIDVPTQRTWIAINKIERFGHLPMHIEDSPMVIDVSKTTAFLSGEGYSLPYTNEKYCSQPLISDTVYIQPYEHAEYKGEMKVYPSSDSWFETEVLPDKRVTFDQTNYNLIAYGKVSEGIATQWDSWRTLSTGIESIGEFTIKEQLISSNDGQMNNNVEIPVTSSGFLYNKYKTEKITDFQERTGKKIAITPDTITQDLGQRVIDNSVIPRMRQIPLRLVVDGLAPNTPHSVLFEDTPIEKIYSYNAKIPTDIDNPYDSGLEHYNNFLAMQDFYISKIPNDYIDCYFDPDVDGVVITNSKGMAAFTIMIPENLRSGNKKIEIVATPDYSTTDNSIKDRKSYGTCIFYGQGFQNIKQEVSASIKRTIQVEEVIKETRKITSERDVLTKVTIDPLPPSIVIPDPPAPTPMSLLPLAESQFRTTKQNTSINLILTGIDTLPDIPGSLSFEIISSVSHGSLVGTAPNITYTPTPGYTGIDSFEFKVKKGIYTGSKATVSIFVQAALGTVRADNFSITIQQGETKEIVLRGHDYQDRDLVYVIDNTPKIGTLEYSFLPTVNYTAGTSSRGTDSFTYYVTTNGEKSNIGFVTVNVLQKEDPCPASKYHECDRVPCCNLSEWLKQAEEFVYCIYRYYWRDDAGNYYWHHTEPGGPRPDPPDGVLPAGAWRESTSFLSNYVEYTNEEEHRERVIIPLICIFFPNLFIKPYDFSFVPGFDGNIHVPISCRVIPLGSEAWKWMYPMSKYLICGSMLRNMDTGMMRFFVRLGNLCKSEKTARDLHENKWIIYLNQLYTRWQQLYYCLLKILKIEVVSNSYRDPIAQSFFINEEKGTYLSGIGIYFKYAGLSPVKIDLRKQLNGYPSAEIIASKTLLPEDISVSEDGSIKTDFNFDDLIWIEKGTELSFSVFSSDKNAEVFQATLGKPNLETDNIITKQPAAGVLFKSPNQSTWIAEPLTDLKFDVHYAEFDYVSENNNFVIEFNEITGKSFSIFCFDVTHFIPSSCSLIAQYSVDGGIQWINFIINENVDLGYIANRLKIRLNLSGTSEVSPIIKETASIKFIRYDSDGRYIMRTMETTDTFNNVRAIFMAHKDLGTTDFTPYYSIDDGVNWVAITSPSIVEIDDTWKEYDFIKTGITPAIDKVKMKIELNTNDQSQTPKIKDIRLLLY